MFLPAACLVVSALSALALIYPYLIYPLILRALPTRPIARDPAYRASVSLLFCAFNEERSMPAKIENLRRLRRVHPDLQILAYDDGSSDRTAQLIAQAGLEIDLVQGQGRMGKAHGMKTLAARATGDILVFTDANVTLRGDAIQNLLPWYADGSVGGICGALHYFGAGESATAEVGSAYWKLEEYLKSEESRTGNVMGADGSIFSLRRALYPEFPDSVLDDLTVSMAAVFAGKRLIKVDDVVAQEQLVSARGDEAARKIRIAARAFHTHMFLRPRLAGMSGIDRFKYGSRKFLRWFGGLFLILSVLSGLLGVALLSVSAAGALVMALAAIAAAARIGRSGKLASLADIVIAIMATLLGVIRALRGRSVTIWTPAKSRS